MNIKTALAAAVISLAACVPALSADKPQAGEWRTAIRLYQSSMYDESRAIFDLYPEDELCRGYSMLCRLRMRTADALQQSESYLTRFPMSMLADAIRFESAAILFDNADYEAAAQLLGMVEIKRLDKSRASEYYFKRGYCDFVRDMYSGARDNFTMLEALPFNDHTAPSRYAMGYMDYNERKFADAEKWFKLAYYDPRFHEAADFYILDCEFMQKNYGYVIEQGELIYSKSPVERQPYIARIVSESYLVLGDVQKAREYFDRAHVQDDLMNRNDRFYAGTVLYEVQDYPGAIEQYTRMTDRTDSLGQIANYHLGYSYIKTKNKVAAMEAFHGAVLDFDQDICEDAWFNWAKLSFDLNQDPSAFESYLKRYSTTRRGESIYVYMALSALYRRDYAAAIDAYDKIDELDGDMVRNYVKANYLRAEQLIRNGSHKAAVPYLKSISFYAPKYDKFSQLAKYWLGESYFKSELWQDAARCFMELYNISALSGTQEGRLIPYNAAWSHFMASSWEDAARWFDTYLNTGDMLSREDAMLRRADCDFARRDYKAAVLSYAAATAEYSSPDNIYPYYQQAICQGLDGDRKGRAETLSKVLEASPKAPMYSLALYELGRSYLDLKKTDDAEKVFETLKKTSSDNIYICRAMVGLGMTYRNSGRLEKAASCYKEAILLMPGTELAGDALVSLESIYSKLKHPEKYVAFVEESGLATDKSEADVELMYFNSAEQSYLDGNWEQAVQSLQKFLEMYPSGERSAQAHFYLAESYRNSDRKEKACEEYASSLAAPGNDSYREQATVNYADLCYSLEDYPGSYKLYSSLTQIARFEENRVAGMVGMMRSAMCSRDYASASEDAQYVLTMENIPEGVKREAKLVLAKSLLAQSRRDEAFSYFEDLSREPSTAEGAEGCFMLIKDTFDKGAFSEVADKVFTFSSKAGSQYYWMARAYLVLASSYSESGNAAQARATLESLRDGYEASGPEDDIPAMVAAALAELSQMN